MIGVFRLAAVLIVSLTAASPAFGAPSPPRAARSGPSVEFSGKTAVIDLADVLAPYDAPAARETDGSRWYMLTALNQSARPVTRVLLAADPPDASLHFFPRRARPEIRQVASSDSAITVERNRGYARHAFQVTIPPATSAALAIRIANGDVKPSVLAWNPAALIAQNRQLAIFLAGVAGLIAAAVAIMAGVAVVTMHPVPGWAAVTLLFVLLARLQSAGALDTGWFTRIGGPYGLSATLSGLALAAAVRLTEIAAPFDELWPRARAWARWIAPSIAGLSLLAFVGAPGAIVLVQGVVLVGTAAIAAYLVHCGLGGSKAARVLAPSAAIFALVATASALIALGGFNENPMASGAIAGFVAAGAVLLALAVAAGEGIAILPISRNAVLSSSGVNQGHDSSIVTRAIAAAHQGVFELRFDKQNVWLSAEAASLLGLAGEMVLAGAEWNARVHRDDREIFLRALEDYRSHPGVAFRIEFRARSETGGYPWLELRATVLGGRSSGKRCLGLLADITGRKEGEAANADCSLRDPLTGLANRTALMEDLKQLEDDWASVALGILDVDRFKAIHASLGDAGADEVLAEIASRLTDRFESIGASYRLGGDSFAVILPDGANSGSSFCAELMEICGVPFAVNGRKVFATASAGVALGSDSENASALIENAQAALALAKRHGGGRSEIFVRDMADTGRRDAVALEADLRRGLAENEIEVVYQPIMRLKDGAVAGFEALLRWRHYEKGIVAPENFVPHAEETGLIVPIGRAGLERAVRDLEDWQAYFPIDPPLSVGVNVSRRQLQDTGFEPFLKELIATGGIRPRTLTLEITESTVGSETIIEGTLTRLRALGARLAIDDFGSGISNLAQLKTGPFDIIKVDKSLLAHGPSEHANSNVIINALIKLSHDMGREVVVEGVETERDANLLKALGCDYAQGDYFSPPLDRKHVLHFIAKWFGSGVIADRARGSAQARPA